MSLTITQGADAIAELLQLMPFVLQHSALLREMLSTSDYQPATDRTRHVVTGVAAIGSSSHGGGAGVVDQSRSGSLISTRIKKEEAFDCVDVVGVTSRSAADLTGR